jgi:hypothetical protein
VEAFFIKIRKNNSLTIKDFAISPSNGEVIRIFLYFLSSLDNARFRGEVGVLTPSPQEVPLLNGKILQ